MTLDMAMALAVKTSNKITTPHTKDLRALAEGHPVKQSLLTSFEKVSRGLSGNIQRL